MFQFTFAKMWLLYAQFEIRQKNLQAARKTMVRTRTRASIHSEVENELLERRHD